MSLVSSVNTNIQSALVTYDGRSVVSCCELLMVMVVLVEVVHSDSGVYYHFLSVASTTTSQSLSPPCPHHTKIIAAGCVL